MIRWCCSHCSFTYLTGYDYIGDVYCGCTGVLLTMRPEIARYPCGGYSLVLGNGWP